jgi:hypothetical protein
MLDLLSVHEQRQVGWLQGTGRIADNARRPTHHGRCEALFQSRHHDKPSRISATHRSMPGRRLKNSRTFRSNNCASIPRTAKALANWASIRRSRSRKHCTSSSMKAVIVF